MENSNLYLMYYEVGWGESDEGEMRFVGVTRDEAQAKQFVEESPTYRSACYKALDIKDVRFYYCVGVERGNYDIHYVEIDGSSCDGAHEEKIVWQHANITPIVDDVYVFAANKEEAQSRALELYKQKKEEIGKVAIARAVAVVKGLANESIEMAKEIEERHAKGEKAGGQHE